MSDQGKKVGIVGGIVAALGAAFAHGADDCARIGARSGFVAEAAGVRAATRTGDDVVRLGARAGAAEGAGVRAGRVGAGEGLAESPGVRLGAGAVGDEASAGSHAWQDIAEELGQEAAENGLQQLLDSSSDDEPTPSPPDPALSPLAFELVSLVPTDKVRLSAAPSNAAPGLVVVAPHSRAELARSLGSRDAGVARFVLGYLAPDDASSLGEPDSSKSVRLSEVAARCEAARTICYILACEKLDFERPEPCGAAAKKLVEGVAASGADTPKAALRALVAARKARGLSNLALHGVVGAPGQRRLVASRLR